MIEQTQIKKEFLSLLWDKEIKKVLDLGCGGGFMSKSFAKKGAEVIGIDKKRANFEKLENFKFIEGDIINQNFGKENELIINSLILHFFITEEAIKIIERTKQATAEKGYNLIICMSDKDPLAINKQNNFFPKLEDLKKLYLDWNAIKVLEDYTNVEEHDNLQPHKHHLIFLLAQKG